MQYYWVKISTNAIWVASVVALSYKILKILNKIHMVIIIIKLKTFQHNNSSKNR